MTPQEVSGAVQGPKKPVLLDLFCGAGGAAMGYFRAGFNVVGVDHKPQPCYPFKFILADALEYVAEHGAEYDTIHASPPCQGVSIMRNLPWLRDRQYDVLIAPAREMLISSGKPWVIENVAAAKWGNRHLAKFNLQEHGMKAGYLCGLMFHLPIYFHRLFESSFFWMAPGHPKHRGVIRPGHELKERLREPIWRNGFKSNTTHTMILDGHPSKVAVAKVAAAKGIDWMNGSELSQAIPPAYTEFIGAALMRHLEAR